MKQKIKIKRLAEVHLPKFIDKGEWVDLEAAKSVKFHFPTAGKLTRAKGEEEAKTRRVSFDSKMIPLGVAMQLPDGYEAVVVPRSSLFSKKGLMMTNSIGVIDNSYSSDTDEWKFPVIAFRESEVDLGMRICQFRIQLSQKATVWQKLKWLFTDGFEIEEVDTLGNEVRGGFGSTGE